MPAPFSRLQLAAALIEYDNDDEDPSKPRRNAQESAIFLPFRNRPIRSPPEPRRSADFLGVTLPSETGSVGARDSVAFDRKSRASIDALRNPFGRDSTYEGWIEEGEDGDIEVDLASWGLDALVDKEKEKAKRKRVKSEALPNPHEGPGRNPRPIHSRAMSANMLNGLGEGGVFLDSRSTVAPPAARRHSIGDPLNLPTAHSDEPIFPRRSRSPSAHALIDNIPATTPLHSVPFPTSESVRSPSPQIDQRRRTMSVGSMSKILENVKAEDDNPFAIRPPSPSRMSRFDPKAQRARTISQGTLATQMMLDYEPEQPAHVARPPTRERRYSRLELMRPKVLIMPSPLQNAPATAAQPTLRATEGFELSTDGRPLPPGARAARRASATLSMLEPGLSAPVASNSFTPNPRNSLTLSQLTFRNTLMVDGQRDAAYADIEANIRRATEEGEQIHEPEPEPEPEVPVVQDEPTGPKRPAGKLYGRSLIDDLEARKAEMRGKQRVFRGDDRPSMMARSQVQRSSTLITPEELKQRPKSQHLNSFNSQPELTRRNSVNAKPLLEFEDEIPGAPRGSLHPGAPAGGGARSVFGVDTLWERELAKLKVIEEQERIAEEERKKREFEEEAKNSKRKGKKRGKGKTASSLPVSPAPPTPDVPTPSEEQTEQLPPTLPAIPKTIVRRAPPPPGDDDDESGDDSDASDAPARPRAQAQQASGWHSDEEEGPRRTTGTGPRYPAAGPPLLPPIERTTAPAGDDSSEEDVPLVATIGRAAQRHARSRLGGDDESSDEEKPLSTLLDKTKGKLPSVGSGLSARAANDEDEDEDDKPLGLRVSHIGSPLNPSLSGGAGGDDDDDRPLGLHPDQLRKSQFVVAQQQQQQQQQQMFAQAQMAQMAAAHQSMMFGAPSMMGSGFFVAPQMTGMSMPGMAAPQMMMFPQQLPPTPPPIQDASKFGRVDKWRHDVAVEGERS